MKRIFSLLVMSLALVVSCQKEGPFTVNEIKDLYSVPADAIELPSISGSESVWATDRRYFNLSFGSVLSTTLVGYEAILPSGQYLLGEDAIGNAVKAKTKLNGQAANNGFLTVNRNGSTYSISAVIDGTPLTWSGILPFKEDPAAVQLTQVISAQKNQALNSVSMCLASDGVSSELGQNKQKVLKGNGSALSLDLYSEDGYLHEGTYVPCKKGGVINEGEFGIGYDSNGENLGTCKWTVSGSATATKILDGVVTVTKTDDGWQIAWGAKYPLEYVFNGAIPALTKSSGGGVDIKFTYTDTPAECYDPSFAIVSGVMKHCINIVDGEGNTVLYLELVRNEGDEEIEGEYESAEYARVAGQLANGFDIGFMNGGSFYITEDGSKVFIGVGAKVSVKKLVKGAYEFIGEGFDIIASGPDYVPGSYNGGGDNPGGGDDDDVTGDVVLKITSGLTYTMEDVTAGNTNSSQQPLSGMTLWRVTVANGSDTVAAFDLGTSPGSEDITGTYTVMSYPDAVGKAGNGWGWLPYMVGGCYFVADGNYYFIPAEATITVSANGDGTLKFKFEGAIQNSDYSEAGTGGVLLNNVAKS